MDKFVRCKEKCNGNLNFREDHEKIKLLKDDLIDNCSNLDQTPSGFFDDETVEKNMNKVWSFKDFEKQMDQKTLKNIKELKKFKKSQKIIIPKGYYFCLSESLRGRYFLVPIELNGSTRKSGIPFEFSSRTKLNQLALKLSGKAPQKKISKEMHFYKGSWETLDLNDKGAKKLKIPALVKNPFVKVALDAPADCFEEI